MLEAELAEVDAFLAEPKTLVGLMPAWGQSGYGREWQVRWGVADSLGIEQGDLCFTVDLKLEKPSIVLVFRKRPVYRLDMVAASETKPNPFGAKALGLPAMVTGSHTHPWTANREWVRVNGFGELPYRNPTPQALRTLEQALAQVADDINLTLTTDQRDCRLPRQASLFNGDSGRGGA